MGDKSPKSKQKNQSQKQTKTDSADKARKQAIARQQQAGASPPGAKPKR